MFESLPYEAILHIASFLNTWELIMIRRLNKHWREASELTKTLWKNVYLPKMTNKRLTVGAVKLAIQLGNRKVKELVITAGAESKVLKELKPCLFETKDSLMILDLKITKEGRFLRDYSGLPLHFPKLRVYRFLHSNVVPIANLNFIKKDQGFQIEAEDENEEQVTTVANQAPLTVLWVNELKQITHRRTYYQFWDSKFEKAPLLESLTSLRVEFPFCSNLWHEVLTWTSSKTLKHLEIKISNLHEDPERENLEPIEFPNLVILRLSGPHDLFPYWMKVPPNLIFVSCNVWDDLPPIEEMWIKNVAAWEKMVGKCGNLKTLRYNYDIMKEKEEEQLLALLDKRAEETHPIETLVVPFKTCRPDKLEVMRRKVKILMDLGSTPRGIDLDVEI